MPTQCCYCLPHTMSAARLLLCRTGCACHVMPPPHPSAPGTFCSDWKIMCLSCTACRESPMGTWLLVMKQMVCWDRLLWLGRWRFGLSDLPPNLQLLKLQVCPPASNYSFPPFPSRVKAKCQLRAAGCMSLLVLTSTSVRQIVSSCCILCWNLKS